MIAKAVVRTAATLLVLALGAAPAAGQEMSEAERKGTEIMRQVYSLPVHEKVFTEALLRIYDKQDELLFTKRFRSATYFADYQQPMERLQRSINYFYAPADDKGNGSINIEHADSDDDEQYLYLKQTRKARRIIGSAKRDDFMGSDFSLGDVTRRRFEDYDYEWLGEEVYEYQGRVNGRELGRTLRIKVDKVETRFKDSQQARDWGEGKSIVYVDRKTGVVFRAERYNLQMQLDKVMTVHDIHKTPNADGKTVWEPWVIQMRSMSRGTRSVFEVQSRRYGDNADFSAGIFTVDSLTKQWWR